MAWWSIAAAVAKVVKDSGAGAVIAGKLAKRDRPADPAPVPAGLEIEPAAAALERAPGAAMVAVLSIPGRLTSEGRDRLSVSVSNALRGIGSIRLIALEEGIGIRFYDVRGGEVTAGGAGVVLDLPAWKLEALEALQSAIGALGPDYLDRAGGPDLARGEAERRIKAVAAKLIGIHPAIVDPRR